MKKIVFLVLSMTFCSSLFAYDVSAVAPSGQTLYYNINYSNGTAQVTSQFNTSPRYVTYPIGNITIPSAITYNGYTFSVTSIGTAAFSGCDSLTSITLPNTITSIGSNAFHSCSRLTSINIPSSVTSIGSAAFRYCYRLQSLSIPSTVTSIATAAFDKVKHIEYYGVSSGSPWDAISVNGFVDGDFVYQNGTRQKLFAYIGSGGAVTIPSSVKNIGASSFQYCDGLITVIIPSQVTNIGNWAFRNCEGLSAVYYNAINCSSMGASDYSAFYQCPSFTTLTIGDGVTTIPNNAFKDCCNLNNVTIPNSINSIGNFSFYGCNNLLSVSIPSSVETIGSYAFYGCSSLNTINIPDSVAMIGAYAFASCDGLVNVSIGDSVTSIEAGTFLNCSNLSSVSIGESVSTIGNQAFKNCSALATASIPNSVSNIGSEAFSGCNNLSNINLGESVVYIGNDAFAFCSNLVNIVLPNSVTGIGEKAFYYCTNMTAITIGSAVINIGDEAFEFCPNISSMVVVQGNTHFDSRNNCNAIISSSYNRLIAGCATTIIPNTITAIGNHAFHGCSGLSTIAIPNSVLSIGNHAFSDCSGLISVSIGDSTTSIGNNAFYNCENMTSVYIGNSVSTIGSYSFYNCLGLTSITFPPSVRNIGDYAFYNCTGLTEIYSFYNNAPNIGSYSFNEVSHNIPVRVPCGSLNWYYLKWTYFFNIIEGPDISIQVESTDNAKGSTVILTHPSCNDSTSIFQAIPSHGYYFTQWNDGNTDNPRTITLTKDTSFYASFAVKQYTVTGMANVSVRGEVYGTDTVDYLDTVVLTATANYGYHFVRWSDNNTDNPRHVVAVDDITITAIFDYNKYYITVTPDTSAHGSCSGSGNFNYLSNRVIQANASYGYHFVQWNDSNTSNPRTITLTKDTSFIASFAKNTYSVNVVSEDTTRGNVTGGTYSEYLDTVTILATANYGYHFSQWNDGDTNNPRRVTLTQNITLTAYFAKNSYDILGISDDETMGLVSGGGTVEYLDSVFLDATANYGYHFTQWNDGDTNNPRIVTVTQDTMFTALFAKNQYTLTVQSNDETQGGVSNGGVFDYLDTVTIVASASEHYHFVRWDDSNTDNPREYVIVADTVLTAIFAADTHTVSVTANDIARGMVEVTGTEFAYGSPCTVTATAYTGYAFSHWSNGITENPYTFAVLEDTELMAIFEEEGTQGIEDLDEFGIYVYAKDYQIHIDEATGEEISVYTIDGRKIASMPNATDYVVISVTTTGVYIVKIGHHPARKVVVIR